MDRKSLAGALFFVVISCFLSPAAAQTIVDELSASVPSCARQCLASFVSVNYGIDVCGETPTLQCLCAHVGASGFTLGEGAVQCMAGEEAIGFCSEEQYNRMCRHFIYMKRYADLT